MPMQSKHTYLLKTVLAMTIWIGMHVTVSAQNSLNMQLLGHYNDTSLAKNGTQIWNDVMGWHDTATNKEYLITGTTDSIYFFDITNPSQLKICGRFWGTNRKCINRDYYPYQHYLYAVSDQCETLGNLQIFDMQYLPDSVVKVYESDSLGALTHSIFIEEKRKRMYMHLNKVPNKITGQLDRNPMDIISLEDPVHPVKIGTLKFPAPYQSVRVHESYVRNDTAYCSGETAGLFIFDVRQADTPTLISAILPPYPQNAYNHSSWLDSSGRYLLFCDETPEGVGMKIYDLKDMTSPRLVGQPFKAAGSPHNSYWMGRYAYTSMYYGGVHVYDLNQVDSPILGAFYDTYPQNFTGGYEGCWGVWPFLPSGLILASDMQNGLFIFKTTEYLSLNEKELNHININTYPNPFTQAFSFTIAAKHQQEANLAIYNLQGKLVLQKSITLIAGANTLTQELAKAPGMYFIKLTTNDVVYTARIIKQ